jgi:hypothetical protein
LGGIGIPCPFPIDAPWISPLGGPSILHIGWHSLILALKPFWPSQLFAPLLHFKKPSNTEENEEVDKKARTIVPQVYK